MAFKHHHSNFWKGSWKLQFRYGWKILCLPVFCFPVSDTINLIQKAGTASPSNVSVDHLSRSKISCDTLKEYGLNCASRHGIKRSVILTLNDQSQNKEIPSCGLHDLTCRFYRWRDIILLSKPPVVLSFPCPDSFSSTTRGNIDSIPLFCLY